MDNFTNYVFLKCYNGSINCVIGELLGLDAWPYPADQAAANAEFVAALDKWAGLYLASGPFICGEELTIADLGIESYQVGWSGGGQEIVSIELAPEREAGEVIEDEGDGHERIVAFLEELKVI